MPHSDPLASDENPLASDSARSWERLIEALGPASLLVVIDRRMSAQLRRRISAEDVLQETLLHAWRDRGRCEWRGLAAFRSWFLTLADHRIRDLAQHASAQKRGGRHTTTSLSAPRDTDASESSFDGVVASTTPSRVASYREHADLMHGALDALPEDVREVVRLRLFEERSTEEVAAQLGLGLSAVKHRLRKGAALYGEALREHLDTSVLR